MSVPWWKGRLVGFDIESTSAEVETARIVTAAIVVAGGGLATETLTLLANPGVDIEPGATEVHGITNERARAEGQAAAEVVAAILSTLAPYLEAGAPLCAFSARFDLTILDREARRHGLVPLQDRAPLRVVDGLVIDKHLDRFRRGSRKLDAICEHHGVILDDAHEASADALAAARLAWCLGARGEVVRRVRGRRDAIELAALRREWEAVRDDLERLHGAQREWAFEQATSLREYFAGRGQAEDAASVRTDWPIVPLPEPERAAA